MRGGEIVVASENWPACLNPIIRCDGFFGGDASYRTVLYHVLPRAMEYDTKGNLVASPLIVEAPTLDNGGLTQNPFTVTYHLNPEAVWDDGSPITSEDIAFTWRAILHTKESILVDDYEYIEEISTPDSETAILRFGHPIASWSELFGGLKGFVLKAAAFASVDPKRPDLRKEMRDEVPFSGGPFVLKTWSRDPAAGTAVLIRNERYFGKRALLDQVNVVPRPDAATELTNFLDGQFDAVAPTAGSLFGFGEEWEPAAIQAANPDVSVAAAPGAQFEGLWFDANVEPLDDPLIRLALMYAIDRQMVVDTAVRPFDPAAEPLDCGFLAIPDLGPWCQTRPFARFHYDPELSRALLEQAGYHCSATPCTRNGHTLQVRFHVSGVSTMRTAYEEKLVEPLEAAGFELRIVNIEGGILFGAGCIGLSGVAVQGCSRPAGADPSITNLFACDRIPTQADPYAGENRLGYCNPRADHLMAAADAELDPARRLALMQAIYQLQAQDMIGLPLYAVPAIVAWRNDRLAGPIDRFLRSPYGPLFNLNEWYVAS